jgi:transposase-like protein
MSNKTRQSSAFERMTDDQQHNMLRTLYESALRTGSIRAIEDRHRIGRNRIYRWCKKNGLPVPKPQMGPKRPRSDG